MYPRLEPKLELDEVARDWARDLPQRPETAEIFQLLLQAFWRGELTARIASNNDPRPRLLDAIKRYRCDSGLLFVDKLPDLRHTVTRDSDGSVFISQPMLFWPDDPAVRTSEIMEHAYAVLADLEFDVYADLIKPVLLLLEIQREDFAAFCQQAGYSLPKFWFQRRAMLSAKAALKACRQWLKEEVRRNGSNRPPRNKPAYLAEAQR